MRQAAFDSGTPGEETDRRKGRGISSAVPAQLEADGLSLLRPVSSEHLSHCFGAFDLFGKLRAGSEDSLDGGGVVACFSMPAILGTMDRPAKRRAIVIGVM